MAAIVLSSQAFAETRFLNLSVDTIAGRRVSLRNGQVVEFHNDHRLVLHTKRENRVNQGAWRIDGYSIKVSWSDGRTTYYSPYLEGGKTFIRFLNSRRGTLSVGEVVQIEAL